MFKKEYLGVFIIAGLAIAYAFFSFFVFISKGRWTRALKNKLALGTMIVTFSAFISGQAAFTLETPPPTLEPTIAPTPMCYTPAPPPSESGAISIVPESDIVASNSQFITTVFVNSPSQLVGAYGIQITFDQSIIEVNPDIGMNGVEAGADGFVAAVNNTEPGKLVISGFDITGTGPGTSLHLLTINWNALQAGTSALDLTVDTLVDPGAVTIGVPTDIDGSVTVIDKVTGDVNIDGSVDIIDALLVSQHYVGLDPQNFDATMADVNNSGAIDIIDALLISQKYVGLIDEFPES